MDGGAWCAAVHGVVKSQTRLRDFTFTFHFHALEKEMAAHSSVLAWRIPGTGEPGRLPSVGSHRVGHDWSGLQQQQQLVAPIIVLYLLMIANNIIALTLKKNTRIFCSYHCSAIRKQSITNFFNQSIINFIFLGWAIVQMSFTFQFYLVIIGIQHCINLRCTT